MANRERGELRLVARNRVYTGRLTVQACCELQDRSGRSLADTLDGINAGQATALRWLVWAALQAYHQTEVVTTDDAGAVMTAAGGARVVWSWVAEFMALNADDTKASDDEQAAGTPDERPGSIWRRLYLDARCADMPPEAFWGLSLRELWLELAAARQRQQQQRDRDLSLAWWTEGMARQKRLPKLETLLNRQQKMQIRQPQSWQDMKAAMNAIAAVSHEEKHATRR